VTSRPKWKPVLNALPSPSATGSRPPRPTNPTAGNTVGPDSRRRDRVRVDQRPFVSGASVLEQH
jgi:hypothetical protein